MKTAKRTEMRFQTCREWECEKKSFAKLKSFRIGFVFLKSILTWKTCRSRRDRFDVFSFFSSWRWSLNKVDVDLLNLAVNRSYTCEIVNGILCREYFFSAFLDWKMCILQCSVFIFPRLLARAHRFMRMWMCICLSDFIEFDIYGSVKSRLRSVGFSFWSRLTSCIEWMSVNVIHLLEKIKMYKYSGACATLAQSTRLYF